VRIRPAGIADVEAWSAMRAALWPEASPAEHLAEARRFFAEPREGPGTMPEAVLVAETSGPGPRLVGFAEVSRRLYAEGCETSPVGFLEGWYVAPEARRRGVGRALVAAAERWAEALGCREFASDALADNETSARAHHALGFEEVEVIRCFRKGLGTLATERLELVPGTPDTMRAALESRAALAAALGVVVPDTWPPEFLDPPALEWTLARLEEAAGREHWWLYFILLRDGSGGRTLIGSAGYKGPPDAGGTVELGYGIVRDQHRRGYASETTRALVERAFARPGIRRVIAETLPELVGSIGVLRKCGFRHIGEGSEPGVIRYELTRDEYLADRAGS
jgi:RimJ/RimL family protein N-acetyltransferase